jgi:endonuclease YncB( thermonuclease family)
MRESRRSGPDGQRGRTRPDCAADSSRSRSAEHGGTGRGKGGRRLLTLIVAWALAGATLLFGVPSFAAEVLTVPHGRIAVVSGDTIRIDGSDYRLAGIHAPKPDQQCEHRGHAWACGLAAADKLRKLLTLETRPVTCFVQPASGPPPVATCMVDDSEISVLMLRSGYVAALPDAAPYYAAAENRAQQASLGIWASTASPPWIQADHRSSANPFTDVLTVHYDDVSVIDGDSIQIGAVVYRLAGIDAPELGQDCDESGHLSPCGLTAAYDLRKLFKLEKGPITCFIQPAENTPIATCMVDDRDISDLMLKGGYVTAIDGGSPHYAAAEHLARNARLGIWSGTFLAPREWRDGKRLPAERESGTGKAACRIKGTVTAGGGRFYYTPLDDGFDAIAIDPKLGERLFCSDDEARQAGWKRRGEEP